MNTSSTTISSRDQPSKARMNFISLSLQWPRMRCRGVMTLFSFSDGRLFFTPMEASQPVYSKPNLPSGYMTERACLQLPSVIQAPHSSKLECTSFFEHGPMSVGHRKRRWWVFLTSSYAPLQFLPRVAEMYKTRVAMMII
jgi:hypothetical protein